MCVDYRTLNAKTIRDRYPLSRIDDKLDGLHGSVHFSSLDLRSGYYQIPVAKESQAYTAFSTPQGQY